MWNKVKEYCKNFFAKENFLKSLRNFFLILLGTFILSVGSGFFLIPFEIVSGGITGITILTSSFISPDIMSYILSWFLFIIGFIFLGAKFTISSLISTIFYPVFISIILRTGILDGFVNLLLNSNEAIIENGVVQNLNDLNVDTGLLLIIGILGGALVGLGCALTFHGGGSTGGLDILTFIISKYTGIKESIPFFLLDGTIVLIGLCVDIGLGDHGRLISSIVGIISAFICSMVVEVIYSGNTSSYQVDVISEKYEDIIRFAIEDLDRSATVFEITGAYSKENKKLVRICFSRREYTKIKNGIAKIDPYAFCTFSQTLFVGGEGFEKIKTSDSESLNFIKKIKKKGKK